MEIVGIKVEKRTGSGKKAAKALRRNGNLPCIMYGGKTFEKLTLNTKEFLAVVSGENARRVILKVEINGNEEKHNTILKELQYHPITDSLIHADLLEISLNEPLTEKLPLKIEGVPKGVTLKGGQLKFHLREIEVECLPELLPAEISIDVSNLDVDDSLTIGDIRLAEGISKKATENTKVVSVAMPKAEPVAAAEDEQPADEKSADEKPADEKSADKKSADASKAKSK